MSRMVRSVPLLCRGIPGIRTAAHMFSTALDRVVATESAGNDSIAPTESSFRVNLPNRKQ